MASKKNSTGAGSGTTSTPNTAEVPRVALRASAKLWIVRLFDRLDDWIDVTGPLTREEAERVWNKETNNGKKLTKYEDGDYYDIFPADTRMVVTPEFLGR